MSTSVSMAEAVQRAADALMEGVALRASRTPREAAEAAWFPGHRLGSVAAIELEIRRRRAEERAAAAAGPAELPQAA